MNAILGLFAKWPTPGQAKTRLAVETSPAWAATAAEAFLRDTVQRCADLPVERWLLFDPDAARSQFQELAAHRFVLMPQAEGDLGHRLEGFFRMALTSQLSKAVAIGSDSPTLPIAYLSQAFDLLDDADVVLGPTIDGGYYLIGCRVLAPLFAGIAWSTSCVLAETVQRVKTQGLRLAMLSPWWDVDTLADWFLLRGQLGAMRLAGIDPKVPHTEMLPEPQAS